MSYGGYKNYGAVAEEECEPSTVPRPTGMCRRYAMNVPPYEPYINPETGVRRKVVCPPMEFDEGYTDVDTEVDDDFSQAEEDCREEIYSGQAASPMPWGNRYAVPGQNSVYRLENLIKEETEEIEQSKKYLRHANAHSLPKPRGFWDLSAMYRDRTLKNNTSLDLDTIGPDVAAAMLSSEEQGQALKHIPPAALFTRLFPEDNRKCTLMVKGASKYHRDHVIPERGALWHGDNPVFDVDPGIVPYGEMVGARKDSKLPKPMYQADESCPDGVCESSKKPAKVQQFKATRVDDDGVEVTWLPPQEKVKGFQVYYAPVTPNDKKGSPDWKSTFITTPRYDIKWSSLDPKTEGIQFAISPILTDSTAPDTPSKNAKKLDVSRPKTKGKSRQLDQSVAGITNIRLSNASGGVKMEWETPPNAQEGAFIEFKSDVHTKMQYKATRENEAFLPVPENQGKLYVSIRPRSSGMEPVPIVEILWDNKLGKIVTMMVDEADDEQPRRYYTVSSLPPLTGNFIQLRGSQPPPWFPGYFTVQPGIAEVLPLAEPNEALEKAWASMGPSQVNSPHGNFLLGKP